MRITPRRLLGKALELTFNGPVALLPNRVFGGIRPRFLRAIGASVGPRVKISRHVKVLGARSLRLGADVAVANSVILDARGGLELHEGALIGFDSVILSHTHAWPDPSRPVHHQGAVSRPVSIGRNVWIGTRVVVLPGASIGDSSVIGASSVVSGAIPALVVASGNPATVVADRQDRSAGA